MARNRIVAVAGYAALAVMLALACGPSQGESGTFDILGLRLGMTEAEARAVLQEIDPRFLIRAEQQRYLYNDGMRDHQAGAALGLLRAESPRERGAAQVRVVLRFSPMPGEPRVVSIYRNEQMLVNPPTGQQFHAGLVQKYGPPVAQWQGPTVLAWDAPGGIGCSHHPSPTGGAAYRPQWQSLAETPGATIQSFLADASRRRPDFLPADPRQCAASLMYSIGGADSSPVIGFWGVLVDVGAWAAAETEMDAWLQGLAAEARAAREKQGQTPRL